MTLINNYASTAKDYDKGRLDYPIDSIREFLTGLPYKSGDRLCDLGAGTGKLTGAILHTASDANIVAVEPSEKMSTIFKKKFPTTHMLQAAAEAIALPDHSIDIVVVGTAFHWFATQKALAEISRILKPDGRLGLIWSIWDWYNTPWVKEIRHLLDHKRAPEDLHKVHDLLQWQEVFTEQQIFEPLKHTTKHYTHLSTEQDVINRMLSSKIIGALSADDVQKLCKDIRSILTKYHLSPHALDIPYRIEMYWTKKI